MCALLTHRRSYGLFVIWYTKHLYAHGAAGFRVRRRYRKLHSWWRDFTGGKNGFLSPSQWRVHRNFFGGFWGGSTHSVEDRRQREQDLGVLDP
jgi:hypothetical protein